MDLTCRRRRNRFAAEHYRQAGDLEGARKLARQNLAAFSGHEDQQTPIVTNAGGCGAMLASYDHLLSDDPDFSELADKFSARVRDVSQQLETVEIQRRPNAAAETVTYDASCHLLYGQHAGEAPLGMIEAIDRWPHASGRIESVAA